MLRASIAQGDAAVVLGSRLRGRRERGTLPSHEFFGNRLAARLLRHLHGLRVTDLGPLGAIHTAVLHDLAILRCLCAVYATPRVYSLQAPLPP